MPKPQTYAECRKDDASIAIDKQIDNMDETSRMRATKVINVFLCKVWRRRCTEVYNLHQLMEKYQKQVGELEKRKKDLLFFFFI